MIQNLVITAFRNLKRNFSYTAINVIGLCIGMACCLTVFTMVNFEYSFDNWHEKQHRIYRYTNVYEDEGEIYKTGIVPYPTGEVLANNFPEIEQVVEFHGPMDYKVSFEHEGKAEVYREGDVLVTDGNFFEVLDFKLISGNPKDLNEPFNMFLSEAMATKYFQGQDPVGKVINIEIEGKSTPVQVAGLIENSPDNTNLPYSSLLSMATLKLVEPEMFKTWTMTWAYTAYVLIQKGTDIAALNVKIDQVVDATRGRSEEGSARTRVVLQPLADIHTAEEYGSGYNYIVPSQLVWALILLATLILVTGCLNFINLSTALAFKRSKEIGIRKVLGSSRKTLAWQFLVETCFIVCVSLLIASGLAQVLIDEFADQFSPTTYTLEPTLPTIIASLVLIVVVTLTAGLYPAVILSGYKPLEAIKNRITLSKGTGNFNVRRGLIVVQFAFTILMIVSTIVISSQIGQMKQRNLGFDTNGVLLIKTPYGSENGSKSFLNELNRKPFVKSSTLAFSAPSSWSNQSVSFELIGTSSKKYGGDANVKFIDANYLDFYDIPLLAGKNVTEQFLNDSTFNSLVTRMTASSLGFSAPEEILGKTLSVGGEGLKHKIIGVVEDFNVSSAHNSNKPVILTYDPREMYMASVRLPTEDLDTYLSAIEVLFERHFPDELFEYWILSSQIDQRYAIEDSLLLATSFISIITIILAGIGLYGLVSFMAARNTKAIGIRKVFGATTGNILRIFSVEYAGLLVISFLIATPIGYWLLTTWVEGFATRIELSSAYFLLGFFITLLIAIVTVGYRSFMAAKANPIKALRYE